MKLIVLLSLFLAGAAAIAADNLQCPSDKNDGAAVSRYRDSAISLLAAGPTGSTQVKESVQTCFPAGAPKCLDALRYELNHPLRSYENDGGGGTPTALSSERDLPPEFLVRGADNQITTGVVKFPANLMQVAKQKGWKAISYKTRSTGGFDTAPNLTLVAIPGVERDVYLQISPPPDGEHGLTHTSGDPAHGQDTLTVIAVDKTKNPPVGELRLLSYDEIAGGYRWKNNLQSQGCIGCHTTPLRPISPRGYLVSNSSSEPRMSPQDERTVTEINEMMLIRKLSWGETGDPTNPTHKGPHPGRQPTGWAPPGSETRDEAFIKNCASNLSPIEYEGFGGYTFTASPGANESVDWRKVSRSMNCVQCHNGETRGPLHDRFSNEEIQFKVLVDRSMPAQNADVLNMSERIALVRCLKAERGAVAERWKQSGEWMKQATCGSAASGVGTLLRRRASPTTPSNSNGLAQ